MKLVKFYNKKFLAFIFLFPTMSSLTKEKPFVGITQKKNGKKKEKVSDEDRKKQFMSMGNEYYSQEEYEKGVFKPDAPKGPNNGEVYKLGDVEAVYADEISKMKAEGKNQADINRFLKDVIIDLDSEGIEIYDEKYGRWLSRSPYDNDGGLKMKERLDERFDVPYAEWIKEEAANNGFDDVDEYERYLENKERAKLLEEEGIHKELEDVDKQIEKTHDDMLTEEVNEFTSIDHHPPEEENDDFDVNKHGVQSNMEAEEDALTKVEAAQAYEEEEKRKKAGSYEQNALPSETIHFNDIENEFTSDGLRNRKTGKIVDKAPTEIEYKSKTYSKTNSSALSNQGHVWNNNIQEGSKQHEELIKGKPGAVVPGRQKGKMGGTRPVVGMAHPSTLGGLQHIPVASGIQNWIIATDNGKRPFFSTKPAIDDSFERPSIQHAEFEPMSTFTNTSTFFPSGLHGGDDDYDDGSMGYMSLIPEKEEESFSKPVETVNEPQPAVESSNLYATPEYNNIEKESNHVSNTKPYDTSKILKPSNSPLPPSSISTENKAYVTNNMPVLSKASEDMGGGGSNATGGGARIRNEQRPSVTFSNYMISGLSSIQKRYEPYSRPSSSTRSSLTNSFSLLSK